MAKRKRQSTHKDDKSSKSELTVSRKRNGDPNPVQAHVLAWLDHCLETGVAFRQTAPNYMKHITTQDFTWAQLDQKLRGIIKTYNRRPPYTPVLLEKGTTCLHNFDGTQLQVRVIEIRSSLPSRSPEILGELSHGSGLEVVLSSNTGISQHTLVTSNQATDLVDLPSATSARRAICVDSESPPSSPSAPPQPLPQDGSETTAHEGRQPYFELNETVSNETAAQINGVLLQTTFAAANDNRTIAQQRSQCDQRPDGATAPSPCSSGLSSPPSDIGSGRLVDSPMDNTRFDIAVDEINRSLHGIHSALANTESPSTQPCSCSHERDNLERLVLQLKRQVADMQSARLVDTRMGQGFHPPTDRDIRLDFYQLLSEIDQICLSLASGDETCPPLPNVWDRQSPLGPLIQRASTANQESWMAITCARPPGKVEMLRCLIASSIFMNVFEHSDLGLLGGSCYLLAKYRETILLRDGLEALRKTDRSAHERVREDPLVESQLQRASKTLAGELEETLSTVCQLQVHEENDTFAQVQQNAMSPTRSMFQKIFANALSLKALLLQTGQRYRADFVPTGARFDPNTMSLVGLESMEMWQQSRGLGGSGEGTVLDPPRAVRFCVFPAIHAYPLETEWASKADASGLTVDYCNFVSVDTSAEGTRLVSKAAVTVFE